MRSRWTPRAMRVAPELPDTIPSSIARRSALLINPFYPKDPHASFGKHALTPTLALTSVAGATPTHWQVVYWDENLLQGPPPLPPGRERPRNTNHPRPKVNAWRWSWSCARGKSRRPPAW